MGAFCVLLSLATGVDYGWQPAADGSLTYLIQVEPELLDELSQPGFAIESVIPDDLRGVRRFKIYVGTGEVPRIGSPHAAVQAQWSQYVEPASAAASGTEYLNQAVPRNDPYGVVNGYLPPALQAPVWSDQAVTKDSVYSWSQLARDYLSNGSSATATAGAGAPPLTLPPDFQQGIAALPETVTAPLGNAWNQATQTLAERGLDPRQILPQAEDRIKQEWNAGVAGAEAALDRFGNRIADQANRTVGAWTGTEITRTANPAAPSSPVGTGGGAFAAAPPVSQPAAVPTANAGVGANGGLGMPAGPSFSPPATNGGAFNAAPARDLANAPAFNSSPPAGLPLLGAAAPPLGGAFPNGGLAGSPLAGGPISGGNSLDGGSLGSGGLAGGGLAGGSSLDAPPLAGSGLGSAPPLGGSLDGGGSLGGGSSLGSTPGAGGLGNDLGGSLGGGGGLGPGPGSLAGGGSSLGGEGSLGGGSLGGGSLEGPAAGGSLGGPATLPGDQPFGVPQVGSSRPDDNPFGVPIVARTEVAKERRTLPYAAVPIRPDFSSDLLDGPPTIEVTPASAPSSPFAWNWGGSFDQNGRPWGPLFLTAVILFLSVGLNCYLAWISRGLYERYKNLVFSRRHSSTTAAA